MSSNWRRIVTGWTVFNANYDDDDDYGDDSNVNTDEVGTRHCVSDVCTVEFDINSDVARFYFFTSGCSTPDLTPAAIVWLKLSIAPSPPNGIMIEFHRINDDDHQPTIEIPIQLRISSYNETGLMHCSCKHLIENWCSRVD